MSTNIVNKPISDIVGYKIRKNMYIYIRKTVPYTNKSKYSVSMLRNITNAVLSTDGRQIRLTLEIHFF